MYDQRVLYWVRMLAEDPQEGETYPDIRWCHAMAKLHQPVFVMVKLTNFVPSQNGIVGL